MQLLHVLRTHLTSREIGERARRFGLIEA